MKKYLFKVRDKRTNLYIKKDSLIQSKEGSTFKLIKFAKDLKDFTLSHMTRNDKVKPREGDIQVIKFEIVEIGPVEN